MTEWGCCPWCWRDWASSLPWMYCTHRGLLSMVLKRPEPMCYDWRLLLCVSVCVCVCDVAISSSACCLRVCVCVCVSVCLCSSKTLPDPPVFVFAPRAPLHFASTEGKPCVKMQLTPFPQQDTQHKEQTLASTTMHSALLHVKACRSHERLQTLFSEDVTYDVSKNSLLSGAL